MALVKFLAFYRIQDDEIHEFMEDPQEFINIHGLLVDEQSYAHVLELDGDDE